MRPATFCVVLLVLLAGTISDATWGDAGGRGIIPYWLSGGDWYSLFFFANGSEETDDLIYLRMYDEHSPGCSDTTTVYGIRAGEMLTFSTTAEVPTWIPVHSAYGYLLFRAESGGFIHAHCIIYNRVTQTGYTVPAYNQDHGF